MITITQNDYGKKININCKDYSKNNISLGGYTPSIDMVFPDKSKHTYSLTITNLENGIAQLLITAEMTAQTGIYKGYVTLTSGSAKITMDDILMYNVIAEDGGV